VIVRCCITPLTDLKRIRAKTFPRVRTNRTQSTDQSNQSNQSNYPLNEEQDDAGQK
jgi:hypothetical protein